MFYNIWELQQSLTKVYDESYYIPYYSMIVNQFNLITTIYQTIYSKPKLEQELHKWNTTWLEKQQTKSKHKLVPEFRPKKKKKVILEEEEEEEPINVIVKKQSSSTQKIKTVEEVETEEEEPINVIIKKHVSTKKQTMTEEKIDTSNKETILFIPISTLSLPTPKSLKYALKMDLVNACKLVNISLTYSGPISNTNPIHKIKDKTKEMLYKEYEETYQKMFPVS
jgi:hypothetical protein